MADRVQVEPEPDLEPQPNREPVTGVRPSIQRRERDAGDTEELELEPEAPLVSISDTRARSSVPPPPPPVSSTRLSTPPPRSVRELREALRSQTRATERGPSLAPSASTAASSTPPALPSTLPRPHATEVDRLHKQLREREARLSELEAILDQRAEALIAAEVRESQLLARVAELEALVHAGSASPRADHGSSDFDASATRESGSAREPSAFAPPATYDDSRALAGDDLRLIRGIGPGYQRALVALGIQTFARIAAWTPEDVATVSRQLGIAPGRIDRDRWIEQARSLAVGDAAAAP